MPHASNPQPKQLDMDGPQQLFQPEVLGASFQQLAVDVVRGETTDFMSRWFRAKTSDADLVIWTDSEKRIVKHQLCFFGQVVEWNPIYGTRTGVVIEEELSQALPAQPQGDVAETIKFDQLTATSVVAQAIRVLANVPELNDFDRAALIFNLRESPKLHKRARERALKVWAPKVDEINSTRRPKFWKRIKTWVLGD